MEKTARPVLRIVISYWKESQTKGTAALEAQWVGLAAIPTAEGTVTNAPSKLFPDNLLRRWNRAEDLLSCPNDWCPLCAVTGIHAAGHAAIVDQRMVLIEGSKIFNLTL